MTAITPLSPPTSSLEHSRAYCLHLTKSQAKNFYYGLKLLPEPKRSAMYALYAYMRLVDDIADDDAHTKSLEERKADLDHWQELTHQAYSASQPPAEPGANGYSPKKLETRNSKLETLPPPSSVWPAFIHLIQTYRIPQRIFDDMIAGQRQDLSPAPIRTFADLHQYCYRVASVVGIASLYVWGFDSTGPSASETLQLAADRGIAFQLTNILRDLHEDAAKPNGTGQGRCYLPEEDLAKFQIAPEQIGKGREGGELAGNSNFLALMQFQIARARSYYDSSAPLAARISADSRPTLQAMTDIYRGILEKIAENPAKVLTTRVKLSTPQKLLIAWRALRRVKG
ncbi:MAG: squalene/phytoene synthase family protein [Phycisphaerales bacterium]|nr:squalene/phytoene synthase family protein [Phycisphaerales bacterium]